MGDDRVRIVVRTHGVLAKRSYRPRRVRCAFRRGVWAVTQVLGRDGTVRRGEWALTHVPSGRLATRGTLQEMRAACRLAAKRHQDWGAELSFGEKPSALPHGLKAELRDLLEEVRGA